MSFRLSRKICVLLAILAAQGLAVIAYLGIEHYRARSEKALLSYERIAPGQGAPDLILDSPDDSTRNLSDLRGKTILLHFWATWCPPCKEELPVLLAFGRDLSRKGHVLLVAVSLDEDWESIRDFLGGEIPSEIVRDRGKNSITSYDLSKLPETYLIAPDGTLQLRLKGAAKWSGRSAKNLIRAHIKE